MDFKDLKTKPDEVKKIAKNFKEWYDEQQPKKRCDMIAGHDNYWGQRFMPSSKHKI